MFLNAEEIAYKAQKEVATQKRLSFSRGSNGGDSHPKGAIVLSYSKELLSQVYSQARMLDLKERLLINRATSSLQMKTPVVEFITPDKTKGERELSEEEQFEISIKNVINNASWKLTDMLLVTPVVMSHILQSKEKYDPYDINPAVIVVDEFDELLQNPAYGQHMLTILRKFASFQTDKGNPLAEMNRLRQFIFTGATIPKTIATQAGSDALQQMQEWFSGSGIRHIRSENCHRISAMVEQEWIDLDAVGSMGKHSEESELNLLVDLVRRSLDVLRHNSIMIFADSKKSIDKICDALLRADIKNLPYYQDTGLQGRQTTLQLFFSGELPVMVCSNMAARGLDTMQVDHVIQYEFAKNVVDYIHRVGRTGRMGQRGGVVTNMVRKGDQELVERIRGLIEEGQPMDKLFSRKRSLRKNIKRQGSQGEEQSEDE
ncbi:hypothetical protein FGO68_gene15481 [Halteria grandinella]|uniref:ATP-dependent RNA helicase n=1 Tax=Halteria grandinella TaxID=5974 RepID=A0A8J8P1E1_HALGN|nr:hypothetical protein FGO68_gene15481 [Halteria grandinella]